MLIPLWVVYAFFVHELCAFSTKERKKQSNHRLKSLTEHMYMHRIRAQHTHQGVAPETIGFIPCESFFNNSMYPERVSQKNILKIYTPKWEIKWIWTISFLLSGYITLLIIFFFLGMFYWCTNSAHATKTSSDCLLFLMWNNSNLYQNISENSAEEKSSERSQNISRKLYCLGMCSNVSRG